MNLVSIPAERPFLATLAAALMAEVADDPLHLTRFTILLPTRRAVRGLSAALLRAGEGRPMLLPRLLPIGDLDAEDLLLSGQLEAALPPAVPPLDRIAALARLIGALPEGGAPTAGHRIHLAEGLAGLIDEATQHKVDMETIETLAPEDYAGHWQQTLRFLRLVTQVWPTVRPAGALDPAERRGRLLRAQAAAWASQPPPGPVWAAGIASAVPDYLTLLQAVLRLPQGRVILAGLDHDLSPEQWEAVGPTHPQATLKAMLEGLAVARAGVPAWPADLPDPAAASRTARLALWRAALGPHPLAPEAITTAASTSDTITPEPPPEATPEARTHAAPLPPGASAGLHVLEAPSPQAEAQAIALLLRAALEQPGRTAALVTPDRLLAARVAAAMQRFGVTLDDSAGRPLAATPPGRLLMLLAEAWTDGLSPVPLLALLKHPLAAGGRQPARFRALTRLAERRLLGGMRPLRGLDGLTAALEDRIAEAAARGRPVPRLERLRDWLEALGAALAPLARLEDAPSAAAQLALWVEAAEALSAAGRGVAGARLWAEDAGEALARLIGGLIGALEGHPPLPAVDWPGALRAWMGGQVVRPRFGAHPRLSVLGLLEARLEGFDTVILAGLNEGVWPGRPVADPWLSPSMRAALGLPDAEQRIGAQAADLVHLATSCDIVWLTRTERDGGAETRASPLWQLLTATLRAHGLEAPLQAGHPWVALAGAIDRPAGPVRARPRPAPTPPRRLRPTRLSVTEVEVLRTNPYGFYAKHVLGLRPADPLDPDYDPARIGQTIHLMLERWLQTVAEAERADPAVARDPDRLAALLLAAAGVLEGQLDPVSEAMLQARLPLLAAKLAQQEAARRAAGWTPVAIECEAVMQLDIAGQTVSLTGRADRIDRHADGGLAIIDYKSGATSLADKAGHARIARGLRPQLPLLGAMATAGLFPEIAAAPTAQLAYWRAGFFKALAELDDVDGAPALVDEVIPGLIETLRHAHDPAWPFTARPVAGLIAYDDFKILARAHEWGGAGDESDGAEA